MKPIDAAELSGLMDGELDPNRAAEVRKAIEEDPALQQEWARLSQLDAACLRVGAQAGFQPQVKVPALAAEGPVAFEAHAWWAFASLALLLAVHCLPKVVDAFALGVTVQAVVLAAVLWLLLRLGENEEMPATALSARG